MVVVQQSVTGSQISKNELWNQVVAANSTDAAVKDSSSSVVVVAENSTEQEIEGDPVQAEAVKNIEQRNDDSAVEVESENLVCTPVPNMPPALQNNVQAITDIKKFPNHLAQVLNISLGQNGRAYAILKGPGNSYAQAVGSKVLNNRIRQYAMSEGQRIRKSDLSDLNDSLQAEAEMAGIRCGVFNRVAPTEGGIVIDLGDEKHTHVKITPGFVELLSSGSDKLFSRSQASKAMAMPAKAGNLALLSKYLNLHPAQAVLFIAWLSYTLAHPKVPASKFVILVLQGNQGSGKSLLCRIIKQLIDPSIVGLQVMPSNPKDIAIAAHNAHVLCFDNLRTISQGMSDILCTTSTGGALSSRQLYSDADMSIIEMHVALVLNGIHAFIEQPDLAQRCLPLWLLAIGEDKRRSEAQFEREFQQDLPAIMGGLFQLIANIFVHLPTVKVTHPERMLDFVYWLAAMEKVDGVPAGVYQAEYSNLLNQGQLDSLQENLLASEVLDFAKQFKGTEWCGTPAELLIQLTLQASAQTQRSREWPQNSIALSKRLKPLAAGLKTQGISLEFTRGKERMITVKMDGVVDGYDGQF